jgi:hypothetical protein
MSILNRCNYEGLVTLEYGKLTFDFKNPKGPLIYLFVLNGKNVILKVGLTLDWAGRKSTYRQNEDGTTKYILEAMREHDINSFAMYTIPIQPQVVAWYCMLEERWIESSTALLREKELHYTEYFIDRTPSQYLQESGKLLFSAQT